ncbi:MAG: hypothetical protein OXF01_04150 [Gemmatimonadetes bacterium]|nr:hypothetical protein [Gemmatimonadota bacterium]
MPNTMTAVTLDMVGEQLREANQGIASLKTDIMKLGDDLRVEFGERFDGMDSRLDGIETLLGKVAAQLGIS